MTTTIFSPGFIIPVLSNISSPSNAEEPVTPPPLNTEFKPPNVFAVPLIETPIALTKAGVNWVAILSSKAISVKIVFPVFCITNW